VITAGLLGLVNQSRTRGPAAPRSLGPAGGSSAGTPATAGVAGPVAVAAMTPSSR
jgi:hypothetical protein